MKKIIVIVSILSFFYPVYPQLSFGEPQKISSSWKFLLDDIEDAASIDFNDGKWQNINLPHDWSIQGQLSPNLASCTGYLPGGIGWYRKELLIPADKKGKKVYLYFEGIYNRSKVYINGQLLGERPNGYVSFAYDATPYIKYGEQNLISVRVDHSRSADSRWYTGSGIYRDVWLVYANPVHIALWGVYAYPEVINNKKVLLHIETEIENESQKLSKITVEHELLSSEGKIIHKESAQATTEPGKVHKITVKMDVNNPVWWDLDNPNLYTLHTKISQDGRLTDQYSMKTGIRSYQFDPDKGFALNGKWMKVKGVCIHHDAGVLGAASFKDVWRRRLLNLKEVGVNAIRTSHNPQASHLYELCDELGFLVMNEAFDEWVYPKRKWLEGWNVGTPGFQGSYDFFKEWGERDLADIVRRDRNHVSIFAWSIGNEVDYPNDPYSHPVLDGGADTGFSQPVFGGYKKEAPDAMELGVIAKRLAAVVRKYDLSRPVTAGLAGVAMSNETEYPYVLDIAGYNYTENRYDSDHKKYPGRIIYGSENRHDLKAWKAVRDNQHIFGQFLWTGIDYLGESGRWPSRGFYSGLLDFCGFIKPRGKFRQALWSDRPVIYIGTYPTPSSANQTNMKDVWSLLQSHDNKNEKTTKASMDAWPVWNYRDGEYVRVVCYTNAASVDLFLNGVSVGGEKPQRDENGIIYWDIPYASGKLEAVGYDVSGNKISNDIIRSTGRPYALTVENENPVISKENGVAHVVVNVVDEHNNLVILADNRITCTIEGEATLLGLEAGDNEDMGDYTDNVQRVFNGRLLAYIQADGKPGTVRIKFSSPLLQPVTTDIEIQ
ncbi:sugar-binding domain-containing protein [Proteiniphilum sp. UBA5384]|jgi:hypothetical protein|uniref:sugar-binding domain-containing protein n=1 Tax=Proteiniphilum sp. UBA5384 TaxID=1947279 RepID=UPI0025FDDB09|nr:sugar-binding domain-containing protein [Proteiniphilum sp. UBA5384]